MFAVEGWRSNDQFSFPAAIAAALACGCSSIFNAASRPLRRLVAAFWRAAEAAGGDEFDLGRAIRLRHQDAGGEFDLDRTVHGAVGADDVEIDQRGRGPGVLIDRSAGLAGGWSVNGLLPDRARSGLVDTCLRKTGVRCPGACSILTNRNRALEDAGRRPPGRPIPPPRKRQSLRAPSSSARDNNGIHRRPWRRGQSPARRSDRT